MIITKKHLHILEAVFDKKMSSIDSMEVLNDDKDYLYYIQLVQMGLLREDEDHFFLTFPGMMFMEAYRMAQYNGVMPDISSYSDDFKFVGSHIINMLVTAKLSKGKVNDIIRTKLEKRGMVVDNQLSEFGIKVLEVFEETSPYFYINKPLQEFLKKTLIGPAPKRELLEADKYQILEAEALRLLSFSAPDAKYYNLNGVGQEIKNALLKGAFFKPITEEYLDAVLSIDTANSFDEEKYFEDENLKQDLIAQAVIDENCNLLPAGKHLLKAAILFESDFHDLNDSNSIDIDEIEFGVLETIKEINDKSNKNPNYLATKNNIRKEFIDKKFNEVTHLKNEWGRRLKELPDVKQKYIKELENTKSAEEWFNRVYDFDAALFGLQGFNLIQPELKDDKMYYILTADGKKVYELLHNNPHEIPAEAVKAITTTRHWFFAPDGRWIEKAKEANIINTAPTSLGLFFERLAYEIKIPNLTKYGLEVIKPLPYTTGMYLDDLLKYLKNYSKEEVIQLIEKLDARGIVQMFPNDMILLTQAGIKIKQATSGLAGNFKYPVTPDIINVLTALTEVGSLYIKERKVRILPNNWKKALKLLKMDMETFENTLTLLRKAGYIGKDSITENGLLLIEAAELLMYNETPWDE
jgi:hypothetical protein